MIMQQSPVAAPLPLRNGSNSSTFNDLTPILRARLEQLEAAQNELETKIAEMEEQLEVIDGDIYTVKEMLRIEARRLGIPEPEEPEQDLSGDMRFLRMNLTDIAEDFIKNKLTKKDMKARLEAINYHFKTVNHGQSVHFAWVNATKRIS